MNTLTTNQLSPKPSENAGPNCALVSGSVIRSSRVLSDYGAAFIGEGIGFAGLCIGLGITDAHAMWGLVVLWVLCFGPSRSIREKSQNN